MVWVHGWNDRWMDVVWVKRVGDVLGASEYLSERRVALYRRSTGFGCM